MNLLDAFKDFETYLRVEKNLSPKTRAAYAYDLNRFFEFLAAFHKGLPALEKIVATDIKEYLAHLQGELNYRPTTLSRTISSIRVFFDFCVEQGKLAASPATAIHNPKLVRRLPIFLVDGEVRKLFESPDQSEPRGRRDHAILVTLAFTGLRLQELVGLNTLDIDFERHTLKVMGKGRKERLVPMNEVVERVLRTVLEDRRPVEGERGVFLNHHGRRISGRGVELIVKRHVLASGILKDKISPHKLRHTFATLLHLREVDLVEIQHLMGHATITSTQIYTHTHSGKLQRAVDKLVG